MGGGLQQLPYKMAEGTQDDGKDLDLDSDPCFVCLSRCKALANYLHFLYGSAKSRQQKKNKEKKKKIKGDKQQRRLSMKCKVQRGGIRSEIL